MQSKKKEELDITLSTDKLNINVHVTSYISICTHVCAPMQVGMFDLFLYNAEACICYYVNLHLTMCISNN